MIKGLHGLRALAALGVLITHLGLVQLLGESDFLYAFHGETGVRLFFVLSGFLITHLMIRETAGTGALNLRAFYLRRALRILPLYFLVVASVAFIKVTVDSGVSSTRGLVYASLFGYNFVPTSFYSSYLGSLWSLAVEEHFYLLWPVLFMVTWNSKSRRKLLVICSVLCILSILSKPVVDGIPDIVNRYRTERFSFCVAYQLLFGCLMALLLEEPTLGVRRRLFALLDLPILPAVICALWWSKWTGIGYDSAAVLQCLGFALLMGWVYRHQESRLVGFLEERPLRYLGKVSYGLYMYQCFLVGTAPSLRIGVAWPLPLEWAVLALIVVVPVSYHLMEAPLMAWGRRVRKTVESVPPKMAA